MGRENSEYRYFTEEERKDAIIDSALEECKECNRCARGVNNDKLYCLEMSATTIENGIMEYDYCFSDFCPKQGVRRYGL